MNKQALILLNMGGPQSLEEIPTYLEQIFNDPNIIDIPLPEFLRKLLIRWIVRKRLPKTRAIYQQIGGGSPLNSITQQEANLLEMYLKKMSHPEITVLYAMRYTDPFLPTIWQKCVAEEYEQIILMSLYPHYSTATTGSFIDQWQGLRKNGIKSLFINKYFDHPAFIRTSADHIMEFLEKNCNEAEEQHLLFSAHGIPVSRVKKGDPYPEEIKCCIEAIKTHLSASVQTHLGFQSKVGPVHWLEPETRGVIKVLAEKGIKKLFVYPISFVADNSESLYEIDILFRGMAKSWGIDDFHCIPCLNTQASFISTLGQITIEAIEGKLPEKYIIK